MKDAAETRLARFIARYSPEVAALARAALGTMRERLPGAIEMVYDNYNALVVGFGPTERASEAVFSIVLYPRYVSLCFLHGVGLPDPQKRLNGSGKQVRHIRLADETTLDDPAVWALMAAAVARSTRPFDGEGPGRIVIKSVSAKQHPRRPGKGRAT
jgi:hypothetical protein